jgi:hypothetical protein
MRSGNDFDAGNNACIFLCLLYMEGTYSSMITQNSQAS